ncbi:MAG: DUF2203 domain-containing protein [Vulcanimicrobiota bacterium]
MDSLKMKFFTLEEANDILPEIQSVITEINSKKEKLARKLVETGKLKAKISENGNRQELKENIAALMSIHQQLVESYQQLIAKGLVVRDINTGFVDFPTIIQGDLGYFSWQPGEETVGKWHPVNDKLLKPITSDLKMLKLPDNSQN